MKHLLLVLAVFVAFSANAQRQSPHDTTSVGNVTITYGRPYKKARDIFGGLVPYGQVWRLGADQATTITFKKDGKFGGKEVKAGTYTLFAIPAAYEWTFILNSELGQWGAFKYEENKSKDVLQVNVPVGTLEHEVEQFTIRLNNKPSMIVEWDKIQVMVPMSF
jgi:hypothetical protein